MTGAGDVGREPAANGEVRVALIGAGRMGAAHAAVLAGIPACRVTMVADVRPEAARSLAARFGARAPDDLAAPFGDDAIDAVLVATPVATHAELVGAAVSAGKAAFVEKPVAATLEAGRELVRVVEAAGGFVQVGFQRRFDPAYLAARRALDEGRIGRPWVFRGIGRDPGPLPESFLRSSGGVFLDMGIHDLDTARWLMGDVEQVYATGGALADPEHARAGVLDTAVATLRFESGAVGTVETAWRNAYGYEVRAEVVGSEGRLVIERDRAVDATFYDGAGSHRRRPQTFDERFREAFVAELGAFVERVRTGSAGGPTVRDAWHSLRLALAAKWALEQGSAVDVAGFGGEEP